MNRRFSFPIVVAILMSLSLAAVIGAADVPGTITRLSTGSATQQQNSPAISGTQVVWTAVQTPSTGAPNFDIYLYDLVTGTGVQLTNTPGEQEFLEDIDAGNVVWTHAGSGSAGDIVIHDTALGVASTVAASNASVSFQQPTIRDGYVAFVRVDSTQVDIDVYDTLLGTDILVTDDVAAQARPRLGPDMVVYEDYASGNADVFGYSISTRGPAFPIATGPANQFTPDIDGNTVVWVEESANGHQVLARDLNTHVVTQLTNVSSFKLLPRISGDRIVWSDDRQGNLDLYTYNLRTGLEEPLVEGPGDQSLADIDGDRVVYTSNETGFEQIYMIHLNASDIYPFSGFFSPVENLPTMNVAKAGSAIPVKFSLGGDQGLNVLAQGAPNSAVIACNGTGPLADIEQTVAAGGSSLTYNSATGVYTYVWKTDKTWAGSCRQLNVRLADGTDHFSHYQFK